ncbi:MAG: tRNA1(Val) (adenine(37)-N6)-methyltransferase [Desulfobacteraceae bacterium]|nr:MAG: tRNA1(Val) (adenine(37)-N6)-methyltransferase [Desulfobacteraceae bacterium]
MESLTSDTFFNGKILIKQNRNGYRFSIDSILLASHVDTHPGDRVIDMGTGCGIIALILAYRNPEIKVYGIEVQKSLSVLASLNVKNNNMEDRIEIICADIKDSKKGAISGAADIVVCNPPYRRAKSGRVNQDNQRAFARHEIKITLPDVFESAGALMRVSGKFIMIYPSERTADIIMHMRLSGIEPKYFRFIYSKKNAESKLVIVKGVKGGRPGATVDTPLIIYNDDGTYSNEVGRMFIS